MIKKLLLLPLLLTVLVSYTQNFADKDYYLVDSLVLEELSEYDRTTIDSCLKVYHNAKHDTNKLGAIAMLIEQAENLNVWPKYNIWLKNASFNKIEESSIEQNIIVFRKMYSSTLSNIGYLYSIQGDYDEGIKYMLKSIEIKKVYNDKIGMATTMNNIGSLYLSLGNLEKALLYSEKSLKIREEFGQRDQLPGSLHNIASIYQRQGKTEKALEYFKKSLKISKELGGNLKGIASILNGIGNLYYSQGDLNKALTYFKKTLKVGEKIGDQILISVSINNIGHVYESQGNITTAIEYYHKSLKIDEEFKNKTGIAGSLNNIATLYEKQRDFKKALEYHQQSLKINQEIGVKSGISTSLNNIGSNYSMRGDLNKALEYFLKSLKLDREIGDKNSIGISLSNAAYIYQKQGEIKKALEYQKESINLFKETGNKPDLAKSYNSIGKIYEKQDNIVEAKRMADKSYQLAIEIGYPEQIKISSELLSRIAVKQKNWKKAYEMHKLSIEMRDSITNEKNQKAAIKSQFKYEYEKQAAIDSIQYAEAQKITDAQLAEGEAKLESKRLQQYFLVGGIISLFIIGGLVFLFYRNKQKSALELTQKDNVIEKQRSIQYKLKALSAQMNPHFIFNSLNSIQYYIVKNDTENSKLFLRKFAGLMRKTLDNSEYTYISLEDELKALKEYIELERLRLDDKFEYSINVDSSIDPDDVNIPTLLIQPYVENAIWHGIAKKKEQGKITIEIKKEDDRILCVIDDNGVGRLKSQNIETNSHKSYAMNITKARLDLINTLEDDIININIVDKTDKEGNPTGTTVQLFVPDDL